MTLVVLFLSVQMILFAGEWKGQTPDGEKFIAACKKETTARIAALIKKMDTTSKNIRYAMRGRITKGESTHSSAPLGGIPQYTFGTKAEKAATITAMKDAAKVMARELKEMEASEDLISPRIGEPKLGDVGICEYQIRILQVTSDDEALVRFGTTDVWLTGFKTGNIVDDDTVTLEMVIEFYGTHTYPTATGTSRKVLAARPFDTEKHVKFDAK